MTTVFTMDLGAATGSVRVGCQEKAIMREEMGLVQRQGEKEKTSASRGACLLERGGVFLIPSAPAGGAVEWASNRAILSRTLPSRAGRATSRLRVEPEQWFLLLPLPSNAFPLPQYMGQEWKHLLRVDC